MNLTDILPLTGEQIYTMMHPDNIEIEESKEVREEMYKRLQPFADAFHSCIRNCGSEINPKVDFQVTMAAICSIDRLIRMYSKNVI